MRSPISWYGGKGMFVKQLLKLLPQHKHYVEVFGGGASLLFAKAPSGGVEVYNDIDSGLVNFYRVLRGKDKFMEFRRLVELTPYSREEHENFRTTWAYEGDDILRAYKFYITCRMSFGAIINKPGWSCSVSDARRGISKSVSAYLGSIEGLVDVHRRLRTVQIDHRDFSVIIKTYTAPGTLLYLDPPYVPETRSELDVYRYEMDRRDHEELVELLLQYPQMAMLSGYNHKVYAPLVTNGWRLHEIDRVTCYSSGKDISKRTECIWLSPAAVYARNRQLSLL